MDEAVVNELLDYRTNNAAKVDEIIDLVKKIIEAQKKTDKDSHFWTQSVDNLTRLYNWQNYVPLKGRLPKGVKEKPLNNAIDLRGKSVSPEFAADIPQGITGRSEDEQMNVILQVQRDAVKSSIRLGQMLSRMTIRNAIRQGIIKDNKRMRLVVKPEDRYKGFEAAKYQKNDWFVYYAPDGNLELYKLTDERQKNAIRQIYGADQLNKAGLDEKNWNIRAAQNKIRIDAARLGLDQQRTAAEVALNIARVADMANGLPDSAKTAINDAAIKAGIRTAPVDTVPAYDSIMLAIHNVIADTQRALANV
jgi:hypothetical protein